MTIIASTPPSSPPCPSTIAFRSSCYEQPLFQPFRSSWLRSDWDPPASIHPSRCCVGRNLDSGFRPRSLFSKYGLVNDSFIPAKRSKSSGCRFGFVRFARRQDAEIAISNLHGVWIENRRLLVKTARFDKKGNEQNLNVHSVRTRNPIRTQDYTQRAPVTNGVTNNASRSYAQVVKEKENNEQNQMGVENRDNSTVQRDQFHIVMQGMNYMVRIEEMETFRVVNPITTPSFGAEFNGRDGDMVDNKNGKDDRLAKNHTMDVRTTQLANKGDNFVNVEDPNKQGGATQASNNEGVKEAINVSEKEEHADQHSCAPKQDVHLALEVAENNKEDTSNFSQELDSFVEDSKSPIMIIGQDDFNSQDTVMPSIERLPSINLQVDLNPKKVRKALRKKVREECTNSESCEYISNSINAAIQGQVYNQTLRELEATTEVGRIIGVNFTNTDLLEIEKMIEKDNNRFALLQRSNFNG
ncbi:hypothetical protein Vadar_009380 [Vaccinium darrowii]|uniref:Uncharacterized protein n=1 Tax=Vaccinium darrowii TaxID=229202 RepID=A0ACB7WZB8_9ERIC|nr:hypothetical protein Vadar_009380 [Vaccinium darrowii]